MKTSRQLLLICLAALCLRLVLLPFVEHPGIADPNHYYNLGLRLAQGHGLTIDYIWQYNNPYTTVTHPDDYWMPLTAVLAAGGLALFGQSVHAALIPFIFIGSILPLLAYAAARQFGLEAKTSLFVAAASAVLPELVLNSLRTDSTIPNSLFVIGALLLLVRGLQTGKTLVFAGSGLLAGLAYLTRSENALLLPVYLIAALGSYLGVASPSNRRVAWRFALLAPAVAVVVVLPWAIYQTEAAGAITTRSQSSMFFLTDYRDHYYFAFQPSLETYLASQSPMQIIAKRLFEIAASIKLMYTTLDMFLPVAVAGGFLLILALRDRQRLRVLAPTLVFLAALLIFYTVLVPYKSQGGSFKKAYLSLIPLLLPLAGYALERAISDRRIRYGAMLLIVGFLAANAVEFVRADARFTTDYLARMERMAAVARTLPDQTGDGQIVLMTQDPFMVRFVGFSSVMFPSDDRDTVVEVGRRFDVDYLLMPPDRPALDDLYLGTQADPRFTRVAAVPGTEYVFFAVDVD